MKLKDFRRGMVFRLEGELWQIIQMELNTPGNWRSMFQVDMKNVLKGNVVKKRISPTEELEEVFLETKDMEYLYRDGDSYVFMDSANYEQSTLTKEQVGEAANFMRLNEVARVQFFDERPISVELSAAVILEVTETEPGHRGNTVSNITKAATLETGLVLKVPNHINKGDKVKVDTRSGEFISRA